MYWWMCNWVKDTGKRNYCVKTNQGNEGLFSLVLTVAYTSLWKTRSLKNIFRFENWDVASVIDLSCELWPATILAWCIGANSRHQCCTQCFSQWVLQLLPFVSLFGKQLRIDLKTNRLHFLFGYVMSNCQMLCNVFNPSSSIYQVLCNQVLSRHIRVLQPDPCCDTDIATKLIWSHEAVGQLCIGTGLPRLLLHHVAACGRYRQNLFFFGGRYGFCGITHLSHVTFNFFFWEIPVTLF